MAAVFVRAARTAGTAKLFAVFEPGELLVLGPVLIFGYA
jgi:hypothetical protein